METLLRRERDPQRTEIDLHSKSNTTRANRTRNDKITMKSKGYRTQGTTGRSAFTLIELPSSSQLLPSPQACCFRFSRGRREARSESRA